MAEPADTPKQELLSDEELRRLIMSDPEVQDRIREALAKKDAGKHGDSPGITAEELPKFLRDHG